MNKVDELGVALLVIAFVLVLTWLLLTSVGGDALTASMLPGGIGLAVIGVILLVGRRLR